jgi:asparagine synthase (glutamine-hydrolysing)
MCGITGLIYNDKDRQITSSTLRRMTDIIHHRGPDDEGFYINQNVGLGFRRLSIIDLHTGHQPLSNENESIFIIFNGEIYNYLEIKGMLINKGYAFRTDTDTEVIIHLYEEYGTQCLQFLRGMFAFAIWDNNIRQLFCARDRFGIKPLYYYLDKDKFVFGSEIKSILRAEGIDRTVSNEALDSYFAFGYITSDLSIYKNIKKLLPGHYLILSPLEKSSLIIKRYWEIAFEPDYTKTENQWKDELEASLSETVKLHMISDVPLGAFLSGGIDSGSVVALMAKNSNFPVKTFSIGFKEKEYNELEYAAEVAKKYNCEHHQLIVEPESINLLPKLINGYDEPFADPSIVPTYYVSRFAREYVTVALSGDGGDELFAGYNIYNSFNNLYHSHLNFHSSFLNKLIWGTIHRIIPTNGRGKTKSYFLSKDKTYLGAYQFLWPEHERRDLLLSRMQTEVLNSSSEHFKEDLLRKGKTNDFITNLQYLDLQTYMVDDILTKVDRASMLCSLEVRVPLLDHKFAELSFKIPSNLKLNGSSLKYIFKQTMKEFLPQKVFDHSKQGFGMPLSLWFKEDLREYVNDTLHTQSPLYSSYLDKKVVTDTIINTGNNIDNQSRRLWSILIFEEWLRQNNS